MKSESQDSQTNASRPSVAHKSKKQQLVLVLIVVLLILSSSGSVWAWQRQSAQKRVSMLEAMKNKELKDLRNTSKIETEILNAKVSDLEAKVKKLTAQTEVNGPELSDLVLVSATNMRDREIMHDFGQPTEYFALVDVSIKNPNNSPYQLVVSEVKLKDSSARSFLADTANKNNLLNDGEMLKNQELAAGETVKGTLCFPVTAKASTLTGLIVVYGDQSKEIK